MSIDIYLKSKTKINVQDFVSLIKNMEVETNHDIEFTNLSDEYSYDVKFRGSSKLSLFFESENNEIMISSNSTFYPYMAYLAARFSLELDLLIDDDGDKPKSYAEDLLRDYPLISLTEDDLDISNLDLSTKYISNLSTKWSNNRLPVEILVATTLPEICSEVFGLDFKILRYEDSYKFVREDDPQTFIIFSLIEKQENKFTLSVQLSTKVKYEYEESARKLIREIQDRLGLVLRISS